jgi:hypothetical protein
VERMLEELTDDVNLGGYLSLIRLCYSSNKEILDSIHI